MRITRSTFCLLLLLLFSAGAFAQDPSNLPPESAPFVRRAFSAMTIRSRADLDALRRKLGREGTLLLEKINRRDVGHIRPKVRLAVPHPPFDPVIYSPFPVSLDKLQGLPKIVLVSLRVQAFAAYENGVLVRWGPVSTGGPKHQTPAGLYHTNWRSRRKVSTINSHWIMPWYFNLHTSMGVAFHQYAVPGRPQSYGCIRLLREDARWIYSWADEWISPVGAGNLPRAFGTPVVVFGSYGYDAAPPWQDLVQNPAAGDVDSTALTQALDRYLAVLRRRAAERLSLERDLKQTSDSMSESN